MSNTGNLYEVTSVNYQEYGDSYRLNRGVHRYLTSEPITQGQFANLCTPNLHTQFAYLISFKRAS